MDKYGYANLTESPSRILISILSGFSIMLFRIIRKFNLEVCWSYNEGNMAICLSWRCQKHLLLLLVRFHR